MKLTEFIKTLFEGWHRSGGDKYTAEISEIEHHMKDTGKAPNCPKCKKPVDIKKLRVTKDGEGDVQCWEGRHSCGAELVIFND